MHQRIDAFELWCWRRLLRVAWTAKKSNQSILKEISPEYSLEGLMLKLKLLLSGHWCKEVTHWKRSWCWEWLKVGGKGDDRGWDGWMALLIQWNEFDQALGVGDGQGSLAYCSPWGCKELDTTERLNWTEGAKERKLFLKVQTYKNGNDINQNYGHRRCFQMWCGSWWDRSG